MATLMKIETNLFEKGDLLFWKCEYGQAKEYFQEILQNRSSTLSSVHLIRCYHSLGAINTKLHNYDEALENYQEVLKILSGKKEIDVLKCYLSMGMIYWYKDDYHQAIDIHQQALQMFPTGDIQSNICKNLANLYATVHQFDLSLEYFEKALQIDRLSLGENHLKFAQTYANLSRMFDYKRDYPQAIDTLLKAKEICSKSFPTDHPSLQSMEKRIAHLRLKSSLRLQFLDSQGEKIISIEQMESQVDPPSAELNVEMLDRLQGSLFGLAVGDALGASVESQPREYLKIHPVIDIQSGGTWGLQRGQFTDDTSMALCLAISLIVEQGFLPYDQLVRYQWWYRHGYMSSTGHCFDIGISTRQSLQQFQHRQKKFAEEISLPLEEIDYLSHSNLIKKFHVYCSEENVAGNGALMRLAPVPLFFYRSPTIAIRYSGISGEITHGDRRAVDACRYYGALIVAALHGYSKEELLDRQFYSKHRHWFGEEDLHSDIQLIAEGSYQRAGGYEDQIRGKGYVISSLQAALWAFWSDENSFSRGALNAVNLGDDTDTTAAIYGQLAGAYYGYANLPAEWIDCLYGKKFLKKICQWILYEGEQYRSSSSDIY